MSELVTAVTQVPPPIENPFIVRSLTEVNAEGHAAPQMLKLLADGQEMERFGYSSSYGLVTSYSIIARINGSKSSSIYFTTS